MFPSMIMNDNDDVACLASGHGGQRKKEEKEHSLNDRVAVVHAFPLRFETSPIARSGFFYLGDTSLS